MSAPTRARHRTDSAPDRHAQDLARACQVLNARIEARQPAAFIVTTAILNEEAARLRRQREADLAVMVEAARRKAARRGRGGYVILGLIAVLVSICLILGAA